MNDLSIMACSLAFWRIGWERVIRKFGSVINKQRKREVDRADT